MNKLFKLKDWLTVPDTARHLSSVFDEEVTEADVLQLGLDGHLKLSVNFPNGTRACLGKIVPESAAEVHICSRDLLNPLMLRARTFSSETTVAAMADVEDKFPPDVRQALKDGSLFWQVSDMPTANGFLHLEERLSTIKGVWDLALIGNERLDVEHRFQKLTDGPDITGTYLSGTFVKQSNGEVASLQESFNSSEMRSYRKKFETAFAAVRAKSAANAEQPPKKSRPLDHPDNYFPAGKLPDDGVLVVRTSALTELQTRMMELSAPVPLTNSSPANGALTRERNTLLKIIGLMVNQRYSRDIGSPYTVAALLVEKAEELRLRVGKQAIADHLKSALELIEKEKSAIQNPN